MILGYTGGLVRFADGLPSEIGPNTYLVTLNGIKSQINAIVSERDILRKPTTVKIGDVKKYIDTERFMFDKTIGDVDRIQHDPFNNPTGLTLRLSLTRGGVASQFFEFDMALACLWHDLLTNPGFWKEMPAEI